ncbi:thiamine diphosphokinase [Candidatus Cloacimonadota bacterium]
MNDIDIVSIIANGAPLKEEILRQYLAGTNILIAADGGAEICRKLDLDPHYIVGDLDSVSDETIDWFSQAKIVQNPDQDTTDLEKSLDYAKRFLPKLIRVFCSFGNRTDHLINNIIIFLKFENYPPLEIYDGLGIMKILHPGIHNIEASIGDTISMFSFSEIKNLKLTNFRYKPQKSDFSHSFCSISNVLMNKNGVISFDSGSLLFYQLF